MRLPIITLGLLSVPFHLFLLFFLIGLKAYRKGKREVDLYHQQTEKRSDRNTHEDRFNYIPLGEICVCQIHYNDKI